MRNRIIDPSNNLRIIGFPSILRLCIISSFLVCRFNSCARNNITPQRFSPQKILHNIAPMRIIFPIQLHTDCDAPTSQAGPTPCLLVLNLLKNLRKNFFSSKHIYIEYFIVKSLLSIHTKPKYLLMSSNFIHVTKHNLL